MTECPECGHDRQSHTPDGCANGWQWGPDGGGPYTVEGCGCPIIGWVE